MSAIATAPPATTTAANKKRARSTTSAGAMSKKKKSKTAIESYAQDVVDIAERCDGSELYIHDMNLEKARELLDECQYSWKPEETLKTLVIRAAKAGITNLPGPEDPNFLDSEAEEEETRRKRRNEKSRQRRAAKKAAAAEAAAAAEN